MARIMSDAGSSGFGVLERGCSGGGGGGDGMEDVDDEVG